MPGSARASGVLTTPQGCGDMMGPCTLLLLSLPWCVLLPTVTDIAFESEGFNIFRQLADHYSCKYKVKQKSSFSSDTAQCYGDYVFPTQGTKGVGPT